MYWRICFFRRRRSACGPRGSCTSSKSYRKRQETSNQRQLHNNGKGQGMWGTKELTFRIPWRLLGFFRFHRKLCSSRLLTTLLLVCCYMYGGLCGVAVLVRKLVCGGRVSVEGEKRTKCT